MTTTIQIRSGGDGFDSRLFFPSTLNVVPKGAGLAGDGPFYTGGSIDYEYGSSKYRVSFTGEAFNYTAGNDVSGRATSADLSKSINGSYVSIGSMGVYPDPDNFYQAAVINSAAWMTPDNLLLALSQQGGAKLYFVGSFGSDKFYGSNSADYFRGSKGVDVLTGYDGNDQFVFREMGTTNFDHITDFAHGKDQILIDDAAFKGVKTSLLPSQFHDITTQKEDADDRILYRSDKGTLYYDVDGYGGAAPVLFAALDNHAVLTYKDFLVV